MFRRDVALVDDLERVDELFAEELAAALVVGERRQGVDHRIAAEVIAVIAFEPPERDEEARRDAVFVPDPVQELRMHPQHLLAARDARLVDAQVDVAPEGLREFGLLAVQLDDLGDERGRQKRRVQSLRRDAEAERLLAKRRLPRGECRVGRRLLGRRGRAFRRAAGDGKHRQQKRGGAKQERQRLGSLGQSQNHVLGH